MTESTRAENNFMGLTPGRRTDALITISTHKDDPINVVVPRTLAFAPDGHLWAAGAGVAVRWQIAAERVEATLWYPVHGMAESEATCLLPTAENVWIGHTDGRISVFNTADRRWHVLDHGRGYPIRALVQDGQKHIWACTDAGLANLTTGETLPEPPEPPSHAAFALGKLWASGMNGLWYYDPDHGLWRDFDQAEPVEGILLLGGSLQALYAVGMEGGLYIREGGAKRFPLSGIPQAICVEGNAAFLLQSAMDDTPPLITLLQNGQAQHQMPIPYAPDAALLARRPDCIVVSDGLHLYIKAIRGKLPEGDLLGQTRPVQCEVLDDVACTLQADQGVWAQSSTGRIARKTQAGWEAHATYDQARMTAAAEFKGAVYIGFAGEVGIGVLRNGSLTPLPHLRYVVSLRVEGETLIAETLLGVFTSTDGERWG